MLVKSLSLLNKPLSITPIKNIPYDILDTVNSFTLDEYLYCNSVLEGLKDSRVVYYHNIKLEEGYLFDRALPLYKYGIVGGNSTNIYLMDYSYPIIDLLKNEYRWRTELEDKKSISQLLISLLQGTITSEEKSNLNKIPVPLNFLTNNLYKELDVLITQGKLNAFTILSVSDFRIIVQTDTKIDSQFDINSLVNLKPKITKLR